MTGLTPYHYIQDNVCYEVRLRAHQFKLTGGHRFGCVNDFAA